MQQQPTKPSYKDLGTWDHPAVQLGSCQNPIVAVLPDSRLLFFVVSLIVLQWVGQVHLGIQTLSFSFYALSFYIGPRKFGRPFHDLHYWCVDRNSYVNQTLVRQSCFLIEGLWGL